MQNWSRYQKTTTRILKEQYMIDCWFVLLKNIEKPSHWFISDFISTYFTTLWNTQFSLVICGILWSVIFADCLKQPIFFTVHSNQYFMSVYALLTRVRSLLFISVQNLNHSLWHHRLRCHSGISFVHSNSPQTNWYWRCLNWPFGHGLFIGYLFKMDCGQRAGFFLPLKWSFVRRLLGTRCTHACQAGCGTHVLQISRLISIRKFGQLRPSVASRPKEGGHDHCGWARVCPRNSKQLT